MRILHVLEPPDGGVAVHVRTLTAELIRRGHDVDAVTSRGSALPEALRAAGARVATVDLVPEMIAPAADARALAALARIMRRRGWDVVHTHGNKGGAFGRALARRLGLPVVHSPHGFAYLSQAGRPRPSSAARRAIQLRMERALASAAQVIVCVSERERADALRDGIGDPDRVVVVHNGIELPAPPPRLRRDPPVVGFMARFHEGKSPLLLIDALAELRRRGVPFRAEMVGEGPMEADVRAAAANVPGIDVRRFENPSVLAGFDVYAHPSRWESLPIALLEAMAVRLPIVASDVGGVAEAVLHGRTGLLVPPEDRHALADSLQRLLEDPEERARMGDAGRAHAEARFTLDRMVGGIEAAYDRARRWATASS